MITMKCGYVICLDSASFSLYLTINIADFLNHVLQKIFYNSDI